jgi:phosphomannomutase
MSNTTDLLREAMAWIDQDPDPATRNALALLIEKVEAGNAEALSELEDRFAGHLTFGTAGLRAELGAGSTRMNRVVVSHAANGLGTFLLSRVTGHTPGVVIGYDARHNSDVFARDTAEVLAGMGITPLLFEMHTPTPVLAFAVRHLDADAGVMVTASHNPPADNGYKVYLGGEDEGSQIVPPADSVIHQAIMASHQDTKANEIARDTSAIELLSDDIVRAYEDATLAIADEFEAAGRSDLRICYTPMHGVGADVFTYLTDKAGFSGLQSVASQVEPDPDFPTVSFPNPEEPGALDLSIELAQQMNADVIVANDPDADRLALAVKNRSGDGYTPLTGNEVGALFASVVAQKAKDAGAEGILGYSIVSSPITNLIARHNDLGATETPTGFKWISRLPGLLFGFEEALGYLVNPETVRDKDGLSAGLFALCVAAELKTAGKTLWDALDGVYETYGAFASGQVSLRFDSPEVAQALMVEVRKDPAALFSDIEMASIQDYRTPPAGQPEADLVRFDLASGDRIIMRPSGTEPKLKVYLDTLRPTKAGADEALGELTASVKAAVDRLVAGLS